MKLAEALRMALGAIWAHKLRSFLTLLGIIFGVATVIVVVTLIEGFNEYFNEKVANLGANAFIVNKLGIVTSFREWIERNKRNKDITMEDLAAIRRSARHVRDAAAMASRRAEIKRASQILRDVSLRGVSYNMIDLDTMKVAHGRYISGDEEYRSAYACFIGHDLADKLFPKEDPLGKEIKIDGRPFRIVGVAQQIGSIFGNPQDNFAIIPISTFQKIYGSRGSIIIRVAAAGPEALQMAQDEVRVVLRARRKLNFNDPDNFGIVTSDALTNLRERTFGTISLITIGVTSIALVVGGVVIMNIMLVSVLERTREIGVRKALGARRRDILWQFLTESTIMALFGGVIGVALAYGLSKLASMIFSVPTALPLFWTALALVVSASVGLFFGIYPAWRAARLDPVEALRSE
jgi:putative ABC transport system permease protein